MERQGVRLRLVEYSRSMPPHWCEKGHCRYLLDGEMEIEYQTSTVRDKPGDGIFIPDGAEHRHCGRVLSASALVFFMESA